MQRVVSMFAAAALALALGGWTTPRQFGSAPPDNHFTLASNTGGDRLVAWPAQGGIKYSFAPRGGRFGSPRLIASPWAPSDYLEATLDERGRAVIAWTASDGERDRLLAAIARPDRPAPAAQPMSPPGVDAYEPVRPGFVPGETPRLAVSPAGRTALAWSEHFETSARFGSTRDGFGPEEHVAPGFVMGVVLGSRRLRVVLGAAYPTMLVEYTRRRTGVYRQGPVLPGVGVLFASDAHGNEFLVRDEEQSDYSGFLVLSTGRSASALKRRVIARGWDLFPYSLIDVASTGAAAVAWPSAYDTVSVVVREPVGKLSSPRIVYKAASNPGTFPPPFLREVAAAPRGGAAIAVSPGADTERWRVVRVDWRGRVTERHPIPGDPVRELHVVSDDAGTAAAWRTDTGLFVTTR